MISLETFYERELLRAMEGGLPEDEARAQAKAATDDYYWTMVDRGREAAKDRDAGIHE